MKPSYIFPNLQQKELLKLLLSSDKDFKAGWPTWKKKAGKYQNLDQGTTRLFPLLQLRVTQLLPNDSWVIMLRNIRRAYWLKNQLLISNVVVACKILKKKKIPFLMTKGGACLYLYYDGAVAARQLRDIDIFVPQSHFFAAIQALKKQGWMMNQGQDMTVFDPHFFHSISFRKGDSHLDLHCHVLHFYLDNDDWQILSKDEQSFSFGGETIWTPSDTFHLLHACIHGLRSHDAAQLQWIIDAHQIERKGQIKWDTLVKLSKQLDCAWPLSFALKYLKTTFHFPVPDKVLAALDVTSTSYPSRRLYSLGLKVEANALASIEVYWWTYVQSITDKRSPSLWITQLYRYLKYLSNANDPLTMIKSFSQRFAQLVVRSVFA